VHPAGGSLVTRAGRDDGTPSLGAPVLWWWLMNQALFERETVVVASPEQTSAGMEDETVILNPVTGTYYGLEGAGAHIWGLLQAPVAVGEIHASLLERYEVAPEASWQDLQRLLRELYEAKLIEVREGDAR
jgi:hypothetical protein